MIAFDKLPSEFQNDKVKYYYDIIAKKSVSLALKRITDIIFSLIILIILIIPIAVIAVIVKVTSEGPVFYRQERVTSYGRVFRIFKFRTMVQNADKLGTLVTTSGDARVTDVGRFLRKYRLDELPQIFNVLSGSMTFVGTRDEYYATLLMPAGITSLASIMYKDEEKLLQNVEDADKTYVETILPEKMKYNLMYIENFGFLSDIKLMLKTVKEVVS